MGRKFNGSIAPSVKAASSCTASARRRTGRGMPASAALPPINMATKFGPDSAPGTVTALAGAVEQFEVVNPLFREMPGNDTHVLAILSLSIGSVRSEEAFAQGATLRENLQHVNAIDAVTFCQGLLALAFGQGTKPFAPDFLTTLRFVANSELFWQFNVNAHEVLGYWNLPRETPELLAFADEIESAADPQEAMYAYFHPE